MHLLQAQAGEISDGTEPIDPQQSPADVVVLSANDTELAALAGAKQRLGDAVPSLRLARLAWLQHPFSVDLYLDKTLTRSRLVIARLLGGEAYWPYGLEQCALRLAEAGVPFVALPGDDKPDEALARASSLPEETQQALWSYFVEGGAANAANLLRFTAHLLDGAPLPARAVPLLRAGTYLPGEGPGDLASLQERWMPGAPTVALVFYRALLQGAGAEVIDRVAATLTTEGLNPLPVFVASLKDALSAATVTQIFASAPPDVVLNATSFAVGSAQAEDWREARQPTVLDAPDVPVFQVVFSGGSEEAWSQGDRGLSPRDIAMNVSLPEVDGRILARAVAFKDEAYFDEATQFPVARHRAQVERATFVAKLAANWARLARTPEGERRVGLILANYPNKDGRLANGVGLDTPESCTRVLAALGEAGYRVEDAPADGAALMQILTAGPTNWLADRAEREGGERLSLADYREAFARLPKSVRETIEGRWGPPEEDPFLVGDAFALSLHRFGKVVVGVQPARGYQLDPTQSYHSPDLPPPHHYLAFYIWLRETFGAQALVHLGKHGNLEWLPGKAVALSQDCLPEAVFGPLPHLYPFIVNDPGEGTQAKRRSQAAIVDHLTPPLTRAETYGPLRDLEALVDEYYDAAGVDPRRLELLRKEILSLTEASGLDRDAGIDREDDADSRLRKLDDFLCELKESQIRDGLHIFGAAPEGRLERDLLAALTRLPRGRDEGGDASLIRALARDLGLVSEDFDPLDCVMSEAWQEPRPEALQAQSEDPWRSKGDCVERLELLAGQLIAGTWRPEGDWTATRAVLERMESALRPALRACGARELAGLLAGLDGRFIAPGPSGAPTRGRPDVLPTGRNFFSVDNRALPTPTAWALGWKSASRLIERHVQDHGDWPKAMALTAWGTANMRTGGDDLAQALALMGVRPSWDEGSRRVTGFEILPLSVLGRPRVDVTLRISGFFRDAFPGQIDLIDSAARAVMELEEPEADNPAAARYRAETRRLEAGGVADAALRAGFRVFGSKPGAYGAGLQALIDSGVWDSRADLGDAFLEWGGYAYGQAAEGAVARDLLEKRLTQVEAVVQNQDNREHDLLDSDDYYQFEGGMAAAVESLSGRAPVIYHNDHARPERPVIRTLTEEVARVVRSRVVNPKWIASVKRHGYKGAFEMAATVDYLFAFAATTQAVQDHHFDLVHQAYLADEETRAFLEEANPAALKEIAARLDEAVRRGLWQPRSNTAQSLIAELKGDEA